MNIYEHHKYQNSKLEKMSDNDIVMGMVKAYRRDSCDAEHHKYFDDHLVTDECRMFGYPDGMSGHFNMRWFKEWCQEYRPHILTRLYALKVFW